MHSTMSDHKRRHKPPTWTSLLLSMPVVLVEIINLYVDFADFKERYKFHIPCVTRGCTHHVRHDAYIHGELNCIHCRRRRVQTNGRCQRDVGHGENVRICWGRNCNLRGSISAGISLCDNNHVSNRRWLILPRSHAEWISQINIFNTVGHSDGYFGCLVRARIEARNQVLTMRFSSTGRSYRSYKESKIRHQPRNQNKVRYASLTTAIHYLYVILGNIQHCAQRRQQRIGVLPGDTCIFRRDIYGRNS